MYLLGYPLDKVLLLRLKAYARIWKVLCSKGATSN